MVCTSTVHQHVNTFSNDSEKMSSGLVNIKQDHTELSIHFLANTMCYCAITAMAYISDNTYRHAMY